MARVKDIESLRSPRSSTYTYKDKPDLSPKPSMSRKKCFFYILLVLVTLFIVYKYFYSDTSTTQSHYVNGIQRKVDWSRFAYSQYATDQHYLCNSLMVFASLKQLNSRADRILFYPKSWDLDVANSKDRTSQLLIMARDDYKVKLKPVEMYTLKHDTSETDDEIDSNSRSTGTEGGTWDASINKLHAFSEDQYDRIVHLDSDITVLQNIDELFFLPKITVAMPRAYWKDTSDSNHLTSLIIVLEPSKQEAKVLWNMAAGEPANTSSTSHTDTDIHDSPSTSSTNINLKTQTGTTPKSNLDTTTELYDMNILNSRYSTSALILPHRPYALVTGEFRCFGRQNHSTYLGNNHEAWDPHKILSEAKIVHFSDWPLPKPWIMWPNNLLREVWPKCEFDNGTPAEKGCEDRIVWKGLYEDFRRRRRDVCRLLSVPAPEWPRRQRLIQGGRNHRTR